MEPLEGLLSSKFTRYTNRQGYRPISELNECLVSGEFLKMRSSARNADIQSNTSAHTKIAINRNPAKESLGILVRLALFMLIPSDFAPTSGCPPKRPMQ